MVVRSGFSSRTHLLFPCVLFAFATGACGDDTSSEASSTAGVSTDGETTSPTSSALASTSGGSEDDGLTSNTASWGTEPSGGSTLVTTTVGDTSGTTAPERTSSTSGESEAGDTETGATTGGRGLELDPGIYVRASDGLDGAAGTPEQPMRTIQAAVVRAIELELANVYVSEGEYLTDHDVDDHVVVVGGVSLWGGFDEAWENRDPSVYITEVSDVGTEQAGSSLVNLNTVMEVGAATGPETIIDGFRLSGSTGGDYAVLWVRGDATIRNNEIVAPEVGNSAAMWLVYFTSSDARLEHNRVEGFTDEDGIECGGDTSNAPTIHANAIDITGEPGTVRGVRLNCEGVVSNNVIQVHHVGEFIGVGVQPEGDNTLIVSNTIHVDTAGSGGSPVGVVYNNTGDLAFHNNIVLGSGISGTRGVFITTGGNPITGEITHNVIATDRALDCGGGCGDQDSIGGMQAEIPGASDNTDVTPSFLDIGAGDYGISPGTLCAVAQGGTPMAAVAGADDLAGTPRTEPWSIGAYEFDAVCG
ncbi:MAG: hypothetical protein KUG77_03295 [Nannocystaceae bacterium]|nr:hypothetical protein [Nannocystaceae bacterium]